MALADGEVIGVVRGWDFNGSSAERGFGPVVGEDGDFSVGVAVDSGEGDADFFADECGVAFVGGIDGYGGVAEHGLGACGGYGDETATVREWVADVVELAGALFVFDFEVGDGGLN